MIKIAASCSFSRALDIRIQSWSVEVNRTTKIQKKWFRCNIFGMFCFC